MRHSRFEYARLAAAQQDVSRAEADYERFVHAAATVCHERFVLILEHYQMLFGLLVR